MVVGGRTLLRTSPLRLGRADRVLLEGPNGAASGATVTYRSFASGSTDAYRSSDLPSTINSLPRACPQ